MKTHRLNPSRRIVITEALIDFLENCFEDNEEADVSFLVQKHFEEFVHWAYDDLIISGEERKILLSGKEWELHEDIKTEAVRSFVLVMHT